MNSVEESIRIERPVKVVYDQWTQFEDFPHFMEGVKEVRQIDDSHLHWEVEMGGFIKTWEAEITEQVPDQFITWESTEGPRSTGKVTFEALDDDATMVTLHMSYAPEGVVENLGSLLGLVSLRIARDLQCFKDFVEARGAPPRAWRGEIHAPEIIPHATVTTIVPRPPGTEKLVSSALAK
jgi:uncharacterized membrane protein